MLVLVVEQKHELGSVAPVSFPRVVYDGAASYSGISCRNVIQYLSVGANAWNDDVCEGTLEQRSNNRGCVDSGIDEMSVHEVKSNWWYWRSYITWGGTGTRKTDEI